MVNHFFHRCFIIALTWAAAALALSAQPQPCGTVPAMTPTCAEACIICDINGFTGINNSTIQGQAPPGFCTTQVHHMQWIAFIAGSTNLTIELKVFKCRSNNGLEVGIYEAISCQNYKLVTDCDTDIPPNTSRIFKNNVPLVIGQYYFFVMDGSANDVCSYTINVLEGTTAVAPLMTPAEIDLPSLICQSKDVSLSTPGLVGATIYTWTIDGVLAGNGKTIKHTFEKPGKYEVCLDAYNVCDAAPTQCDTIEVQPTKETTLSKEICFGECFTFSGLTFCDAGIHDITFQSANACDSIVHLDLKIKDEVVTSQQARICEGDTLHLGSYAFSTAGQHTAFVEDQEGCKTRVNLTLEVIKCNMAGFIRSVAVQCNKANNGRVLFKVTNGTPPFTYTWNKLENEGVFGNGSIDAENMEVTIEGLDEGHYHIEIADGFGNQTILDVFVAQPPAISLAVDYPTFSGFAFPCFGDSLAVIDLVASGGNGGFKYQWSNGVTNAGIQNLRAGDYKLTVTDVLGCTAESTTSLVQPPKLTVTTIAYAPDCKGPNTGYIDLGMVEGGVKPYEVFFEGNKLTEFPVSMLSEGSYVTEVMDANGCLHRIVDTIVAARIPLLSVDSMWGVELGDSLMVTILSSLSEVEVVWFPLTGVACAACLSTSVKPVNDMTYLVSVTSEDGCTRTVHLDVSVIKKRNFVVANAFHPGEGSNGKIRYHGGKDVMSVEQYAVYDRWGNKVYDAGPLPNGVVDLSWDGSFNGRKVNSGVYVWIARVRFLDDEVILYTGSLQVFD
ncbi:MAG: gliding motility-associated C-terminal domain-containing protein [Saprospiraceae bacterium]|nr:gliding motility-associated C-terminal domain-containing protein [Saprospiraceae bacterium]